MGDGQRTMWAMYDGRHVRQYVKYFHSLNSSVVTFDHLSERTSIKTSRKRLAVIFRVLYLINIKHNYGILLLDFCQ